MLAPRSVRSVAIRAVVAVLLVSTASADDPAPGPGDWVDGYARLLERHTTAVDATVGTRVDYRALRGDPDWRAMVTALGRVDPASVGGRAEQLAFWINAYNALAIDLVLRHYPVESIRDIGSFIWPVWKKEAGRIGGRAYSLGEIEHEILRPMGEPRIHGAIVCASISCPDLRREPYLGDRLDAQLDDNMRAWLAHPDKGLSIDRSRNAVTLSPIFEWFEDDFAVLGGVMAVAVRYAPVGDRTWLEAHGGEADVAYFDYDWKLND